jgi:hypothetical protein
VRQLRAGSLPRLRSVRTVAPLFVASKATSASAVEPNSRAGERLRRRGSRPPIVDYQSVGDRVIVGYCMKNADEIAEAIEERASGAAVITACGRPDEPHAIEVIEINEGTWGKRRQTLRETEGVRALAGDKRYGTCGCRGWLDADRSLEMRSDLPMGALQAALARCWRRRASPSYDRDNGLRHARHGFRLRIGARDRRAWCLGFYRR